MVAEIETYQDQLLSIEQDAPGLVVGLSDAQFNWRPAANRWSIAECFDHLNVAAGLFVPQIDDAIAAARTENLRSAGPFAYPLLERLILRLTEPPPKIRFRAPKAFQPAAQKPVSTVMTEFGEWRTRIAERLQQADGLDLRRARGRSPGLPIRWSLGTMFAVLLAHERRHVWQARQVRNERAFPPA